MRDKTPIYVFTSVTKSLSLFVFSHFLYLLWLLLLHYYYYYNFWYCYFFYVKHNILLWGGGVCPILRKGSSATTSNTVLFWIGFVSEVVKITQLWTIPFILQFRLIIRSWLHSHRILKFPDIFLTNVKFPFPTKLEKSKISPGNGLQPLLTAYLSTHLFNMLSEIHIQCTWIYSFLK